MNNLLNLKFCSIFISLQVLEECFESKDIAKLQKAVTELPREEAEYHMKRCVDSGLWVPNAADVEKTESAVYDEPSAAKQ